MCFVSNVVWVLKQQRLSQGRAVSHSQSVIAVIGAVNSASQLLLLLAATV